MEEQVQNQDEMEDFTDDRAAQIEAMAKSVDERAAEDRVPLESEAYEPGPEEEAEAPEEEPEEESEEPEAPETFTAKIDGQEVQVTREELIASYQMQQAAEKRLADAREVLAEVKALRAESQKPKDQPKTPDEIQKQLAELSKEALEAQDAEEFAAVELKKAALYREMFQAEMAEQQRAHQLQQEHHVLQEKHNALKAAVAQKHPDFETLMWAGQDQAGNMRVQPRLEQWLSTQPASTRWALFASDDPSDPISVFDRYKTDTGLVQVKDMAARKEAKKQLDTPPAASRKAAKPTQESREPTPSEIVQSIRKERGLVEEDL